MLAACTCSKCIQMIAHYLSILIGYDINIKQTDKA